MSLKYLIDENVNPLCPNQIRQLEPAIVIKVVGEPELGEGAKHLVRKFC